MKTYLGLLSLLIVGCLLMYVAMKSDDQTYIPPQPGESVPLSLSGDVPEGHEVRTLDVEGMCCTGCSAKLYARLTKVEGLREAAVDPVLGQAQVVMPTETSSDAVLAALTFEDYSATLR